MDSLDSEFEKLKSLLSDFDSADISEIINVYYYIINLSSICDMMIQSNPEKSLLDKISKIQRFILDFNLKTHPKILESLSDSIQDTSKILQSDKSTKESELYDLLRKKMSTREFIEQYQKEIS